MSDDLETAAQFRAKMGGISRMTEHRWRERFPDFPKPVYINQRKYYRPEDRIAFVKARAAESETESA